MHNVVYIWRGFDLLYNKTWLIHVMSSCAATSIIIPVPITAFHLTWFNKQIAITDQLYGFDESKSGLPDIAILLIWLVNENKGKTCFIAFY
jgi:hypothetical protein